LSGDILELAQILCYCCSRVGGSARNSFTKSKLDIAKIQSGSDDEAENQKSHLDKESLFRE